MTYKRKCIFFLSFDKGARVNAKDNMWLTPLHRAVASRSEVGVILSKCNIVRCSSQGINVKQITFCLLTCAGGIFVL